MQKEMKLKCTVTGKDDAGRYTCIAKLYDNTEFTVHILESDLVLQGELSGSKSVEGWIFVLQEGQQNNQVSIRLPQPSDIHGHQVVVSQYELMPRHVTIASFGPTKK